MPTSIIPAFDTCQEEGKTVGRLLTGYGELEFRLCNCLTAVMGDDHVAIKVIYRVRGEEQRIRVADAIMRDEYARIGLMNEYCEAIKDLSWCRIIRNQYAHCQWYLIGPGNFGLSFINFEEAGKRNNKSYDITQHFTPLPLLLEQEAYFVYVKECFTYLEQEYQLREGVISNHAFQLPKKIARPPLHSDNPLHQHLPKGR